MASMQNFIFAIACAIILTCLVSGDQSCLSPTVTSNSYTSTDGMMSTETVIVIEFSVSCKNGAGKDMNLYAEFNGKVFAASRQSRKNSNNYQVSFSDEHKNIPAGTYDVRFFDEESYADLRKAQRSGDDTSSIKSILSIQVKHSGISRGVWVQSEFVTAMIAILVWYLAHNAKCNIQA